MGPATALPHLSRFPPRNFIGATNLHNLTRYSLLIAATIALLLSTGCGSGDERPTEPDSDPNRTPEVNLTATPDSAVQEVETHLSLTCSDPDGAIRSWALDLDGDGSADITRDSAIDTTVVYQQDVTLEGICTDHEGLAGRATKRIRVIPVHTVTVHLRNMVGTDLEAENEPFVRGEGPIDYTLADSLVKSGDSAVFRVPEGIHQLPRARHPDFFGPWAVVQTAAGRAESRFSRVGHRDLGNQHPKMEVAGELTLYVLKMPKGDGDLRLRGTRYTINDLATVIDNPVHYQLGTVRVAARDLPLWHDADYSEHQNESAVAVMKDWIDGTGPGTAYRFSDGYLQNIDWREGGNRPESAHYRFLIRDLDGDCGQEGQIVEANEITSATISLHSEQDYASSSNRRCATAEAAEASGARHDRGSNPLGELVTADGEYSEFGLYVGDVLFTFPPGATFCKGPNDSCDYRGN